MKAINNIITKVKDYVSTIHPNITIEGQSDFLDSWINWWKGDVPDFHNYKLKNPDGTVQSMIKYSLRMPKKIGEDFADLVLNEGFGITIPGDNNANNLTQFLERIGFYSYANNAVELGYSLSMAAVIMTLNNISTEINGLGETRIIARDGTISLSVVAADKIIPITIENNIITECAVLNYGTKEMNIIYYLKDSTGNYSIHTITYEVKSDGTLGKQMGDPNIFNTNSPEKWFWIVSPPILNNLDTNSNLPISIWANCLDNFKAIDNKYDAYNWEFLLGKKRMWVDSDMTQIAVVIKDGAPTTQKISVFDANDVPVHILPHLDNKDGSSPMGNKMQETGGDLREDPISKGITNELNLLSQKLHLGKDYYSIEGSGGRPIQTATAVNSMNMTLIRTIRNYQTCLKPGLLSFIKAIIDVSELYTQNSFGAPKIEDIAIKFEDSIFEDKDAIMERDRKDVAAGLMSPEEYRKKHYNENDKDALLSLQTYGLKVGQFIDSLQKGGLTPARYLNLTFGEGYAEKHQDEVDYITKYLEGSNFTTAMGNEENGNDNTI